MHLRYVFKNNENIDTLTHTIDQLKRTFDKLPSVPYQEENLLRHSLLKSSVFSARIEGNPLTIEQVKLLPKDNTNLHNQEIFNLLSAHKYLISRSPRKLTAAYIKKLHQLVMRGLTPNIGTFRSQPWAIYNQANIAIYIAPPPQELPDLMQQYLLLVNSLPHHPTNNAAIAHFLFEKIHPFPDGNGRVGRLIALHLLKNHSYSFRGLLALEEYIDHHKDHYYQTLEPSQQVNQLIEFFLTGIIEQAKQAITNLKQLPSVKPEDKLLPRRQEILNIVKDHPYCSFNFLTRRFPAVNPKTLHHDLKKLQQENFITKVGVSRGSTYKATSPAPQRN